MGLGNNCLQKMLQIMAYQWTSSSLARLISWTDPRRSESGRRLDCPSIQPMFTDGLSPVAGHVSRHVTGLNRLVDLSGLFLMQPRSSAFTLTRDSVEKNRHKRKNAHVSRSPTMQTMSAQDKGPKIMH